MKPPRSLLSYLASVGCLLSATLYPAGAAQAGAGPAAPRRSRSTPPARAGRLDPAPASGNPSPAAGYRQPNPAEREQFRTALERRGWKAEIAVVPQSYSMPGPVDARGLRHSQPIGAQNATLFADVDGDRLPEWVVGYYFAPDPAAIAQPTGSFTLEEAAALLDERARLVVFKQDAEGAWQISWRSPGLGFEFAPPEFNLKEVNEGLDSEANLQLPLTLRDVDGDGRHEICFHCRSVDREVGELPGVYRYDGSRWVSVAPQADRFSLRDLNRDGKLEVLTGSRFIGYGSGDDDVPRVWQWNGQRFQEASSQFPQFYSQLAELYQHRVQEMEERRIPFQKTLWQRAIQKARSLAG